MKSKVFPIINDNKSEVNTDLFKSDSTPRIFY